MTELFQGVFGKVFLTFVLLLVSALVFFIVKLLMNKSIANIKYKDFEIDFTKLSDVKANGEGQHIEKLRGLLLKELLFTQEFVNRFQPLISTFVQVCKKQEETSNTTTKSKYPSLKYITESLERFRDLLRNSHFNYVIHWDCPIYDKVDNGYRKRYIANISNQRQHANTPDLIDECTKDLVSIDEAEQVMATDLYVTPKKLDSIVQDLEMTLADSFDPNDASLVNKLSLYANDLKAYLNDQYDQNNILSLRYDYAMDIANNMYESLLYWNEKTPRILQSETSAILYIIYQNLSIWLIRNDLPLSQVKLEQYLDTHSENLIAKINEEVIKQIPGFNSKVWEVALESLGTSDRSIKNFFRTSIKDWITGVQLVRFGENIYLGNEDYSK